MWVRGLTAAMVTTEVSLTKQKNILHALTLLCSSSSGWWAAARRLRWLNISTRNQMWRLWESKHNNTSETVTTIYAQTHKIFFGNSRQFLGTFKTNSVMLSTRVFGGQNRQTFCILKVFYCVYKSIFFFRKWRLFSEKVENRRPIYCIHPHQVNREIKCMWFYRFIDD